MSQFSQRFSHGHCQVRNVGSQTIARIQFRTREQTLFLVRPKFSKVLINRTCRLHGNWLPAKRRTFLLKDSLILRTSRLEILVSAGRTKRDHDDQALLTPSFELLKLSELPEMRFTLLSRFRPPPLFISFSLT
jgi:hypothetical protein